MILMDEQRVGEVITASTTGFVAECHELYQIPPLGGLLKINDGDVVLYGVLYHATTQSLEAGRRPVARGRYNTSSEAIYNDNPQLTELLRSEFTALLIGHKQERNLHYYLPPTPARIHSFVYQCSAEEARGFSTSWDFLNIIINAHISIPTEELIAASLRYMSYFHDDPYAFLTTAGKQLARMLSGELDRLKLILTRMK
jgi:hypothetical protein